MNTPSSTEISAAVSYLSGRATSREIHVLSQFDPALGIRDAATAILHRVRDWMTYLETSLDTYAPPVLQDGEPVFDSFGNVLRRDFRASTQIAEARVTELEKANAELVAETHRWSAADAESTRLRDEQRRELLARITELEGAYKFVSESTRQELLENARLRAALESLQSDAQCTIDLYNKIGPTWTSRDSGAEYYDASYVIGSAEERIATIKAALADTKGTT